MANEIRHAQESVAAESLAWVIMPDHMHWLFILSNPTLAEVIHRLKGRSARAINLQHNTTGSLWQRGFHDHALRKEEDLKATARGIIANPLRAGLVTEIGDYPHWDTIWL